MIDIESLNKEPAHLIPYDHEGGCMAQGSGGYWRCTRWLTNGRCVMGNGANPKFATDEAENKRAVAEAFLASSPITQLEEFLSRDQLYPQDYNDMVVLLAKLAVEKFQ